MIKSIKVRDIATYDETGIDINDCNKINFIYGPNGSGKTTLSKFLNDSKNDQFNSCSLQWENDSPMQVLVYNKDFRTKNFGSSDIAGVFTLGQATAEEIKKIEQKKKDLEEINSQIKQKKITITNQITKKQQKLEMFRDAVWDVILKKNESTFREAFTGCLNRKQTFMDKLIQEYNRRLPLVDTRTDLIEKAQIIFGTSQTRLSLLSTINGDSLLEIENDVIWQKKIIGRQDVNIAKLIQKLNISDWVNQGRKHLQDDNICPFCQSKTVTESFRTQLKDFFSGEYDVDSQRLEFLKRRYDSLKEALIKGIEGIEENEKSNNQSLLDKSSFAENLTILRNVIAENLLIITAKTKEPSRSVRLVSIKEPLEKVSKLISDANEKIKKNNQLVDNFDTEKEALVSSIWLLLIDENRVMIEGFIHEDNGLQKGIDLLNKQRVELEKREKELSDEIVEDTKNITSVQPAVDEINKILAFYSFQGFSIVPSSVKNYYQIQRADGTIATETLSEGEITFITFLYFLQRSKGGSTTENVTDNRVLIVDDPISSLDSNVLFVVSSLLKGIINSIKKNEGNIKQLFVLTHNVYFHKETSFIDGRTTNNKDTHYWILRKNGNVSSIQSYEMKNPINTSYELLWYELRESRNTSSIAVQNIMRRIIENYFKILGRYGDDDLIQKFTNSQEQEICRSLLCWINDGSHCIPDDLFVDSYSDMTDKYFDVFEKIFTETGHGAHFNMMINSEDA